MTRLDRALELVRAGDPDGARALLDAAIAEAGGPSSLAHAEACEDRAALALATGDLDRALSAYRDAVELAVVDDRTAELRSRHLLVLADLLGRLGQTAEALRAALEATGIGRAGSTEVARARGVVARLRLVRGEPAADEARAALTGLWGRPEAASALVVDAVAATAERRDCALETYLDTLPRAAIDGVVQDALALAPRVAPASAAPVLLRIAAWLRRGGSRGGPPPRAAPDDERAIRLLIAATNLGPDQDPAGWVAAFHTLVGALRAAGRVDEAARAALGMAAALGRLGDATGAEAAYQAALREAERGDDQAVLAEVLRALGLFLAADGRLAEADQALRRAITASTGSTRARCRVAHGLVLAHAGLGDAARDALSLARSRLPDDDGDAIRADVHLDALAHGRSCGCGSPDGVAGAILRLLVLRSAPEGLVDDVRLERRDGRPHVRLALLRDAVGGEMERVDGAIRDALPVALRWGS